MSAAVMKLHPTKDDVKRHAYSLVCEFRDEFRKVETELTNAVRTGDRARRRQKERELTDITSRYFAALQDWFEGSPVPEWLER